MIANRTVDASATAAGWYRVDFAARPRQTREPARQHGAEPVQITRITREHNCMFNQEFSEARGEGIPRYGDSDSEDGTEIYQREVFSL